MPVRATAFACLALLALTVVGCKSSPFIGYWEGVSYTPDEIAEEIGSSKVTLDEDGFVFVTAVEQDGDDQYAIRGRWEQSAANRLDAEFEIHDQIFRAHAWMVGPDELHATVIVDNDGDSASAVFRRVPNK